MDIGHLIYTPACISEVNMNAVLNILLLGKMIFSQILRAKYFLSFVLEVTTKLVINFDVNHGLNTKFYVYSFCFLLYMNCQFIFGEKEEDYEDHYCFQSNIYFFSIIKKFEFIKSLSKLRLCFIANQPCRRIAVMKNYN